MADWSGMMGKSSGYGGGNEELEEEDVWGGVKNSSAQMSKKCKNSAAAASSSAYAWRLQTAPRIIPRENNNFPPCTHEPNEVAQKSAPVNIPDWSKIYGKRAKIGSWVYDDEDNDGCGHHDHDDGEDDVGDDGDDGNEMVPPHEWVARKLARSQISSFSVCEGIGRTLKGRDLSKVRNAILTKTGFLE